MTLYKDTVIEVKITTDKSNKSLKSVAIKYVKPTNYQDENGKTVLITNSMGGETDWFILPFTFGTAVGKKLFEQYNAGLDGFDKRGIAILKDWLIEMEIIDNAMCY